jgi:diacylglycerol kinase (ATP)
VNLDGPIEMIVNPISGRGTRRQLPAALAECLRRAGREVNVYQTTAAGDATRYASAIASRASCVVVFGGDGTINEVAEGLSGSDAPILIAAAGTENLLAKHFKLPQTAEALAALVLGEHYVLALDLGRVNGRRFHSIFSVGFDADVVYRLTRIRRGHVNYLTYVGPILRTMVRHRWPLLRVECDGEAVFEGRGMAFVGNISRYATGLRIARDADPSDGLLDLVVLPCQSRTGLVRHIIRFLRKTHVEHRGTVYCQCRAIRIESADAPACQIDGDIGPAGPWDIEVLPHVCNLIVPADGA